MSEIQTIAANLIVLRKALGVDVTGMLNGKENPDLSDIQFNIPATRNSGPVDSRDTGAFESQLIRTIGGEIDTGSGIELNESAERN